MKTARVHVVGLANQDVRGHFVFGTAKFPKRCKLNEIIECFEWQREAKCSRFRAVFWSRHTQTLFTYNSVIMPL